VIQTGPLVIGNALPQRSCGESWKSFFCVNGQHRGYQGAIRGYQRPDDRTSLPAVVDIHHIEGCRAHQVSLAQTSTVSVAVQSRSTVLVPLCPSTGFH
jgi:hypothetical protein